jgi:hypothetical protein
VLTLAAIFTGLLSLISVFTTLTMALADMYGFPAAKAYFFFVLFETGFTLGNLLITCKPHIASSSSLKKCLIFNTLALCLLSFTRVPIIDPSDIEYSPETHLSSVMVMSIGLVLQGMGSSLCITVGNIDLIRKAREYGSVFSIQSIVVFTAGMAEISGMILGTRVYESLGNRFD